MTTAKRFASGPLLPASLIVASLAAWAVMGNDTDAESAAPSASEVFFVSPLEEQPAETLDDWVGAADLVVEARVTDEQALEQGTSETASEEGFDLVGREVQVKVDNVLWKSPHLTQAEPTTFSMSAWGWMRTDEGARREVAVEGASRMEIGHTYVIALQWREAECAPGDDTVPAGWSAIGSGATLPADEDTVGTGEFEGGTVDIAQDDSPAEEEPPNSALTELAGEDFDDVESALDQAADEEATGDAPVEEPSNAGCAG